MRRKVFVRLLAASAALVLVGMLAWLSGTEAGARWLLTKISQASDVTIAVDRLEGYLARELKGEGIRIRHADRDIAIETANISWRPWEMLLGRIALSKVSARGVSWHEKKPGLTPPDLTWPQAPPWLARLWGGVRNLSVDEFVFSRPEKKPVRIAQFQARLEWRFGTLTLSELALRSPSGLLSGTFGAAFTKPAFFGELVLRTGQLPSGIEQLALVLTPAKAAEREEAASDVKLTARGGKDVRLSVRGRLGIRKSGLLIHELEIHAPAWQGEMAVKGEIDLIQDGMAVDLQFQGTARRPDEERKTKLHLSGALNVVGNLERYEGRFSLAHHGAIASWASGTLRGGFEGSGQRLTVHQMTGDMMGGRVQGRLEWSWGKRRHLVWDIEGQGLDPARIRQDWRGRINARTSGTSVWDKSAFHAGSFRVHLRDSALQGQTLSGFMDARWDGDLFRLERCTLRGRGFRGTAHGVLTERIVYQVQATDISGLFPGAAGKISGDGWVRRERGEWAGVLKSRGASLSSGGLAVETLQMTLSLNDPSQDQFTASLKIGNASFGSLRLIGGDVHAAGKLSDHAMRIVVTGAEGDAQVSLDGQCVQQEWRGTVTAGWLRDRRNGSLDLSRSASASLSKDGLRIAGLVLSGGSGERFEIDGNVSFKSRAGSVSLHWRHLNLARASVLLGEGKLSGVASGDLSLTWSGNRLIRASGSHRGNLAWTQDGVSLVIERAFSQWTGNEKGLSGQWELILRESGRVEGNVSIPGPVEFVWPEKGRFQLSWRSVDLRLFKPWITKTFRPSGFLNGRIQGVLLGKDRVEASGQMDVSAGQIASHTAQGVITLSVRRAMANFSCKDKRLTGNMSLEMADAGRITGAFALPLAGYFPFKIFDHGPIRLQMEGQLQERGLLSAFFPGIVKETRGQCRFDVGATGTWQQPDFRGKAVLEGLAAYFPAAGIRLEGASVEAQWIRDQIRISSFRLRSAGSELRGSAALWIKSGRIARYEGAVTGQNVPVVYLPEVRVWATPDLRFSGTGDSLTVRGAVRIPEALLHFAETKGVVYASQDTVIADRPPKSRKEGKRRLDIDIAVILGEKVRMHVEGLQGSLAGRVSLTASDWENIRVSGRMEILRGFYEKYGVKLDIVKGAALFDGEPAEMGNLDILALKTIPGSQGSGDIHAGVAISGRLRSPIISLYGRPAMNDQDIISYMVLGRPYRQDAGQSQKEQMAQWAAAILAGGPPSPFQRQLKERLGIDRLSVEADSSGNLNRSLVTVGKYLSPDLYVAFGRSLFGDDYYVSTRYSFLKNWQIESRVGVQSGADIYYRIEFD